MWYLTSENDNRVIYIVSSSNQVVVGRSIDNQVCNFAIPDDPSLSRKHVSLTLTDNNLLLQDLGSRYGTFINDSTDKIESNINIELNENDLVKFGKMNSIWKVNKANLTTCTSTLKGDSLQNLRLSLSKIGGILKSDWDDNCNYLTMPAITLTIKVVLALVQGSNIVTAEFWNKCIENVASMIALPDPKEFMPQVVESTLNKEVVSFLPDSRRRTLFEGKKFIFFSRRQYEMYKTVLIKSGASPMLLSECRMSISMLCGHDVTVIQYTASGLSQDTLTQKNQVNDIVNQLKNRGRRVVADAEIGLAILYCSVDKYCNPSFSFTSEVVKQTSVPVKSSKVLAHESQDPGLPLLKENVKINESLMSEDRDEKLAIKRKLSEFTSDFQVNSNKKLATTCYIADVKNENSKRKLSGDDNPSNPSKKTAMDKENNDKSSSNPSEQVENDNSNDIFNFMKSEPTNSGIENKSKKLNLSRPQKRKLHDNQEEENLFNFVQANDEVTSAKTSKQSIFNIDKNKKDDNTEADVTSVPKSEEVSVEDISAMRGVKLKELMERNILCNSSVQNNLKQEKSEDLEEKMDKLGLYSDIVTICNNLIVKKESFETENSLDQTTSFKNFKKFKKVWPVRRQNTIIHTSSASYSNTSDLIAT